MRIAVIAAIAAASAALAGRASPQAPAEPPAPLAPDALFTVACATSTLEAGPIYALDDGAFGPRMQYINGGVRTLTGNGAHAATNATTQMLIVLRDNPKVRLLFTLAEGEYRIVAKRSAGIRTLADLKGKRVVVPRNTSAHYHLVAMLRSAGVAESAVTIVTAPATGMAAAIMRGEADAISMWEPESQNAADALGSDAVIFQNNKVYREFFSVYSSTDVLENPKRRAELVEFVRALAGITREVQKDPRRFFPLFSRVTGHPEAQIARVWEHHAFPLAVPPDLLDSVTEEEKWVAAGQQRSPRSRAELQGFIDQSIIREATGAR